METKDYKELIYFLEEELMDVYKKAKQDPRPECIGLIRIILSGIVKAETINAMREDSSSERGYSRGNGWYYQDEESMRSYRGDGNSYRRYSRDDGMDGDVSNRRYSRDGGGSNNMSRGSSYHGGEDDELYKYLERNARSEADAGRRSAFEDMMRMMERR